MACRRIPGHNQGTEDIPLQLGPVGSRVSEVRASGLSPHSILPSHLPGPAVYLLTPVDFTSVFLGLPCFSVPVPALICLHTLQVGS